MLKIHKLTDGCVLVENAGNGILIGCVNEAVKYLANQGLGGVKLRAVVLSDTTHAHGISHWAFEFPVYKNLFIDQGLATGEKLVIVGTESQVRRAKEIMRITLLGPTKSEFKTWAERYNVKPALYRMLAKPIRFFGLKKADGTLMKLEELVEFRAFEEMKAEIETAGITVVKKDERDTFGLSVGFEEQIVELSFEERPKAPFKLVPANEVHRPYGLAARVLTYSNGFDPSGGCTAIVVWINGIPVLWDAAPFVSEALASYGICVAELGGVILTHVHDDHSSIMEIMAAGEKVRVYTTPEVYESMLIKVGALLNLDPTNNEERDELEELFIFERLDGGVEKDIFSARFTPHYSVHSIPTFGGRFVVTDKYDKRHELLLSGDTAGPAKLKELLDAGDISRRWYDDSVKLIKGTEDLVIFDGGGDPAGLHPNPLKDEGLKEMAERMGKRLWFGHRSPSKDDPEGLNVIAPGALLEVYSGNAIFDDYGAFLNSFGTVVGVTDKDLRALWTQGEVQTVTFDETICRQGDEPDYFYVVLSGKVDVVVNGSEVAELSRGDFFGELSIINGAKRNASIVTKSAVRIYRVKASIFTSFVEANELLGPLQELWDRRSTLSNVALFKHLPSHALAEFAASATEVDVAPGETIIEEGAHDTSFFVVKRGSVGVEFRDGAAGPKLGAGTLIGERSALTREERSASVIASTSATLLRFKGQQLRDMNGTYFSVKNAVHLLIRERCAQS